MPLRGRPSAPLRRGPGARGRRPLPMVEYDLRVAMMMMMMMMVVVMFSNS